jgi:hypothetical protein
MRIRLKDPVPFRPWSRDGKTQIRDKLPDPQHWVSIIISLETKLDYMQKMPPTTFSHYFYLDCVMAEVYAPSFLIVIQENTAPDGV